MTSREYTTWLWLENDINRVGFPARTSHDVAYLRNPIPAECRCKWLVEAGFPRLVKFRDLCDVHGGRDT